MATVTGLTAARMIAIEEASVVDGAVNTDGDLILTTHGGSTINAGHVKGDPGVTPDPVSFDAVHSLYNPDSLGLLAFRSKYAAACTGSNISLVTIGDSITAGYHVGQMTEKYAFPNQLRTLLDVPNKGSIHYLNHQTDSRWTEVGTVTKGGFGLGAQIANAASIQFEDDEDSTQVEVYYIGLGIFGLAMSDFTVQIDGGTPVNVHPDGTSATKVYTVSGLSLAHHTVKIVSGGANCYITGIGFSIAANGLRVVPAGQIFTKASDWTDTPWYTRWGQSQILGADAFILGLGVNDAANSVAVATYKTQISTIITTMKAITPAILLTAEVPPWTPSTWPDYVTAQYELADTHDLPLLDMTHRWRSHSIADGLGMFSDQAHPTVVGYTDIAHALANAIKF